MNINHKLNVAASPHWRDGSAISKTQKIWLIALLPALLASLYKWKFEALYIVALCIAFSVTLDALTNKFFPSKDDTGNWSSVTLAVILALFLPGNSPWWLVFIACFIMIIFGKKIYGGLGSYPVHPVLLTVAMLSASWPSRFDYTLSVIGKDWGIKMIEPLRLIKTLGNSAEQVFSPGDLILGNQVAGLGNAMVIWLLIGGIFLLLMKEITWHIPLSFLSGVFIMAIILCLVDSEKFTSAHFHLLSGSTVFAAFFLATEHTTSPVNNIPMLLYGLLGGCLLVIIRSFSVYYDGIAYTILLINLCNPLLDAITPKIQGVEVRQNA